MRQTLFHLGLFLPLALLLASAAYAQTPRVPVQVIQPTPSSATEREIDHLSDIHRLDLTKKAEALVKARRYKEAIPLYKEAIGIFSAYDAYVPLAECYIALHDYDRAIQTYRAKVYGDPDYPGRGPTSSPVVLFKYILLLCEHGQAREAAVVYEAALKRLYERAPPDMMVTLTRHYNPDGFSVSDLRVDALTGIGISMSRDTHYLDAEQYLRQALQLRPNHPVANYYLGHTLDLSNKWKEAKPYLRRARELSPAGSMIAKEVNRSLEGRDWD